jgi:AcrR family transcriptional regulator
MRMVYQQEAKEADREQGDSFAELGPALDWLEGITPAGGRLLTAALHAFSRRGFHGATTRDIAKAAQLSPAGMYSAFRSKSALLFELAKLGTEDSLRNIIYAASHNADPIDALRSVAYAHVEWHARNHMLVRVTNYELHALEGNEKQHIMGLRRDYEQAVKAVVDRALDQDGRNTLDPQIVTLLILSLGIDAGRWFSEKGRLSPGELGASYSDLVVRMVTGGDSARPRAGNHGQIAHSPQGIRSEPIGGEPL